MGNLPRGGELFKLQVGGQLQRGLWINSRTLTITPQVRIEISLDPHLSFAGRF